MSELEQKTQQRLAKNAFMQHNYIELESVEPDRAVFRAGHPAESRNPYGQLHGGAIYTMRTTPPAPPHTPTAAITSPRPAPCTSCATRPAAPSGPRPGSGIGASPRF